MCNTAECRADVGCILNNHIGPMSSRLAFPHRTDIGFLPRSDIRRRHFVDILMSAQYRMCNTARCRTDVGCKQTYWSDVESPCISISAPHQLLTLIGFQVTLQPTFSTFTKVTLGWSPTCSNGFVWMHKFVTGQKKGFMSEFVKITNVSLFIF